MKQFYFKKLLSVLLPIRVLAIQTTVLSCKDSAKKNGQPEISVTVDANDKAIGDRRFVKI